MNWRLIALTGYARSGKDVVAATLNRHFGHFRLATGDIIKRELNEAIKTSFGFSAFTEEDEEKRKIRNILEEWGNARYREILAEHMETVKKIQNLGDATWDLGRPIVNARLCRIEEAIAWKNIGGLIVRVVRRGVTAASPTEAMWADDLHNLGYLDYTLKNYGTKHELEAAAKDYVTSLRKLERKKCE